MLDVEWVRRLAMSLPEVTEPPPWSFFQWAITALSTMALGAAAFIWRLMARLERMSLSIAQQRADLDAHKVLFIRIGETITQMNTEYFQLREIISGLPNRSDLGELEDHIGERIETLVARLDRALEKRGG
jgi:hypothetical protein